MSKRGRSYLSASVDVRTYDGFRRRPQTSNLKLSQSYKRRVEAKQIRLQQISGKHVISARRDHLVTRVYRDEL